MIDPSDYIDIETGQPLVNAPLGMCLTAHAIATPDRPAFTIAGTTQSFAQFEAAANRIARDLLQRGVSHDDRVALAMPNRAEYLQTAFAVWKIGATPCPVSHRLAESEFLSIIALLSPTLVAGESWLPVSSGLLYDVDIPPAQSLAASPLPAASITPGKIAHSGGSTGQPKLIIDPMASVYGPDKEGCRRGPRLTLLNPGPLYHSAPFNTTTMALAQGTHIICLEKFDAGQWLQAIATYKADYAYIVPTMMARIAKLPAEVIEQSDLSSIKTLLHMAAPCAPDVKRWWINRVGAEHLWEVYGGTERIGATFISGTEWLAHPGSVGKASSGQEIIITDESGQPMPQGEVGEIHFRKDTGIGKSYTYIGADTRIKGDMDSFGDMGWLDADGYLYVADRRTDMILIGGVNIYPAEIEAVIETLPDVLACAVIGLPEADMGNRLHAIVELAPDARIPDTAPFLEKVGMRLSGLKKPRTAEFTYERIRDDSGKLRRAALRAERTG